MKNLKLKMYVYIYIYIFFFYFADMGNFMDANQKKTVTEGEAAVLNFMHIFSYPRPQVTWFRDGHKIIPSSRM